MDVAAFFSVYKIPSAGVQELREFMEWLFLYRGSSFVYMRGLAAAPGYVPHCCVIFDDVSLSLGFR